MKLILIALFFSTAAIAQQTSSKLTVKELDVTSRVNVTSTTKSSKPCPAMTETQRNAIATPLNGSCIYNTTTSKLNVYNGTVWKAAGGGVDNWLTSTAYSVDDIVIESSKIYQCLTAHTSGTFATDLAALKWAEISSTIPVNLTGPITSVGNATSIASQTGTGSKFVMDTSPALVTPSIGAATGTSLALGGTKAASAIFDAQSTTQGVLPPRMTTAQMNAISSPANGLTVYNMDYNSLASYNSTSAVWTYGFGNLTIATDWVACTFLDLTSTSWGGFASTGSITNNLQCRRQGSNLQMKGNFTTGTTGSSLAKIPLPTNYGTIVTQSPTANDGYGIIHRNFANSGNYYSTISTAGLSYMHLSAYVTNTQNPSTPVNGGTLAISGETQALEGVLDIPIAGWTSNTNAWVQANSNPALTMEEFRADVLASAGTISKDTMGMLASCTAASPSVCTFTTGFFGADAPSCLASFGSNAGAFENGVSAAATVLSATQVSVQAVNTASGGAITGKTITLSCKRTGANLLAAHSPFIIGIQQSVNMYSATPTATTSGTSKDFVIPAGVKRINVSLSGVSTNGSSLPIIQLGATSVEATGYSSSGSTNGATTNVTTGLLVNGRTNANAARVGSVSISKIENNSWLMSGNTNSNDTVTPSYDVWSVAGSKTLSGTLEKLRLTTVNGTDTFDAGNVNVSWEF